MTSYIALFGNTLQPTNIHSRYIRHNVNQDTLSWTHGFVMNNGCLKYSGCYESYNWLGFFRGDLPGIKNIPWEMIIKGLLKGENSCFLDLNGCFSILVINKDSGMIWIISDRRSQEPLFIFDRDDLFCVTTKVSAFLNIAGTPQFDHYWLYESVYFNHPVLDRTFIKDLIRVPPATVIQWRPGENSLKSVKWGSPFCKPRQFLTGNDAFETEKNTFNEVASDYYDDDSKKAIALTAGFDSRTVLSCAPHDKNIMLYTYGMPDCLDIHNAEIIASELNLKHLSIQIGKEFITNLPRNMIDIVRESDGLERILRAELMTVYPRLHALGIRTVLGGVSGDHLFRDHIRGKGNVPQLISPFMMDYIQNGKDHLEDQLFVDIFGQYYDDFRYHICQCFKLLQERHGLLTRPEGYLRYLVYENAVKYFGGEASLANNYLNFRSIYWDPRIVELAFNSENGTVGLSERLPAKDKLKESQLQARIIREGHLYGGGKIQGISVSTWARGNRILFTIEKTINRGVSFVANGFNRYHPAPLLCWDEWIDISAINFVRKLLGDASRIRKYMTSHFIDNLLNKPSTELRLASRLISAEIVLRLIENEWKIFSFDE